MDKFLALANDPNSKIPPISKIIENIGENTNEVFYRVANSLHFRSHVNPLYSLIALRDIVDLSPINIINRQEESDFNPISSYKWLFLINTLAGKTISDDTELETAKLEYVYSAYNTFLLKVDITKPYAPTLVVGVLCAAARLMESTGIISDTFISDESFSRYSYLLKCSDISVPCVSISDFGINDIFSYCTPISEAYLSPVHAFEQINLLISISLLRFLPHVLKKKLPTNTDDFRKLIQPLLISKITAKSAFKVLIGLFNGDESQAQKFKDQIEYSIFSSCLHNISNETEHFSQPIPYNHLIKLAVSLQNIEEIVISHPEHWVDFLSQNQELNQDLQYLLSEEVPTNLLIYAASLLKFGKSKVSDVHTALKYMVCTKSFQLQNEIASLLLCHPEHIEQYIVDFFPIAVDCGSHSEGFFAFLNNILPKLKDPVIVISKLLVTLSQIYKDVQKSSDFHLYSQLSQFIDTSNTILIRNPCISCNNSEKSIQDVLLTENRNYTFKQYGENCIYICSKLPNVVTSISLSFTIKKQIQFPRTVRIYISPQKVKEASELSSDTMKWNYITELNFSRDSTSITKTLPIKIFTYSYKIEFVDFWKNISQYHFSCPKCKQPFKNYQTGTCSKCKENTFLCTECNHQNSYDTFICPQCGHSPYIDTSFSISSYSTNPYMYITSDNECEKALEECDDLLAQTDSNFITLKEIRKKIFEILSISNVISFNDRAILLDTHYNEKGRSAFTSITNNIQTISSIRTAIGVYNKQILVSNGAYDENNSCINCHSSFIRNGLKFIVSLIKLPELKTTIDTLDFPSFLFSYVNDDSMFSSTAIDALISYCSVNPELASQLIKRFNNSLPNAHPQLVRLICSLESIESNMRADIITSLIDSIIKALDHLNSSFSYTSLVLQPLVTAVTNSPLIIKSATIYSCNKVFNEWRKLVHKGPSKLLDPKVIIGSPEILKKLLVDCSSEYVHSAIAHLLEDASSISTNHYTMIFDIVYSILTNIDDFESSYEQCFDVMYHMLKNEKQLRTCLIDGLFDHLVDLLCKEVEKVMATEDNFVLDISVGFSVHLLMKFIHLFLSPVINLRYIINRKQNLAIRIITAYFKLRSLLIQRSKFLNDSLSLMKDIIMRIMQKEFDLLPSQQKEDQRTAVSTNNSIFEAIMSDYSDDEDYVPPHQFTEAPVPQQANQNDNAEESDESIIVPNNIGPRIMIQAAVKAIDFCPDIVIREISLIISPPVVHLDVPIITRKIRSQDDFIPGHLPNQPVNSNQIGTLFRHIKNKICTELQIEASVDMELLVDNNIISLDLPIDEVYKRIWIPNNGNTAMLVICRLQGFDGEATEPMINSFPNEANEEVDPEVKYSYTSVLCENNGFSYILGALDADLSNNTLKELIKLLDTFVLVKRNRIEMNRLGAINKLFKLMKNLARDENSASYFSGAINVIAALIQEKPEAVENPEDCVDFIFEALETTLIQYNDKLLAPFLSLVPPIAALNHNIMHQVLQHFLEKLRPQNTMENCNIFENSSSLFMINGFAEFALAIPTGENGNIIRELIFKEHIVNDACSFLIKLFPLDQGRSSQQWQDALEIPCLPALLKTLGGMVDGFQQTQELFISNDAYIIKLLLELETVSSANSIGEYATVVLSHADKEGSLCHECVQSIKQSHIDAAKQRAAAEKEKAMKEAQQALSPEYLKMLNELVDQSWECCICKEGYEFLPNQLLGVYVYVTSNKSAESINTATYFVCVHPSCHQQAHHTDKRGRQGLSEWEAAMVRNSERPCNSIFPLPSGTLQSNQYRTELIKFLDENSPNREKKQDHFKLIMTDIRAHLVQASTGEKISPQHGGGSFSSIVALWPFIIFAGHLLLDTETNESRNRKAVEQKLQNLLDNNDCIIDALIYSIWILSLDEWETIRKQIFTRLLKARASNVTEENVYQKTKEAILLFILVDRINKMTKKSTGAEIPPKEGGLITLGTQKVEDWLKGFEDTVLNNGAKLMNDWVDFGDELQDEILNYENIETGMEYSEIHSGTDDLIHWIISIINEPAPPQEQAQS